MIKFCRIKYLLLFTALLVNSCVKDSPDKITPVIIGIPSDVESLNPLFAFSGYETILTELLYPALVQYEWDSDGQLEFSPMLAEKWEWNSDSTEIIFYINKNAQWSDGKNVTADDIIFSFDVYSDPAVKSRLFGTFSHFILEEDQHIDIKKTFEPINPHILKVRFSRNAVPELKYFDMPMLPHHIFGSMDRNNMISLEKGHDTVTCGAFYLKSWDKNQALVFEQSSQPFINDRGNISQLIFKIIPDYNLRLIQLKKGEIDFMEDIKTEDIGELKKKNLAVEPVEGKEYDYIGWRNVITKNGNALPHPLFGSSSVRKALTLAINREEIFQEFLLSYGSLAFGPVSPIFDEMINNNLVPLEFNPEEAKKLLADNGWKDTDFNGIIDQNGKEFSFILNFPSGNPRREYAAAILKNNLHSVGIEVKVESLEPGVFFDKMFSHELTAWLAGWVIPVPLELMPFWYSDPEVAPLNVAGYKSDKADSLLLLIAVENDFSEKADLVKSFQEIIYNDNPVTFMYWIDNMAAYNKRINNIKISPLGPFHHCWKWSVK